MDREDGPTHVKVESLRDALSHPQFIIESEGAYYVTLAVWRYDPGALDLSERERQGVDEVAEHFQRLVKTDAQRRAVQLIEFTPYVHQHTS